MAAAYLNALRSVQPVGPYRLGGWSMGGVVAFEMALQLRAAGEEVALLALIDATAPAESMDHELDDAALLAAFADDLARLSGGRLEIQPGDLRQRSYDEALSEVVARIGASGALPPEMGRDEIRRLYEVYRTNLRAMHRYKPGPFAGDLLLFRAAGEQDVADPALGWSRVVSGRLTAVPVAGDHYEIMREPLVAELAGLLRTHLDAAARTRKEGQ
jgi:thioesterase domain-containing protein